MIELPEAVTISEQMRCELSGKRIATATANSSPHKWAFYTGSPDDYAGILEGRVLGESWPQGSHVVLPVGGDHFAVFGGGGERILYHTSQASLPKKHQLLLQFDDDTLLTVSVQGWGSVLLLDTASYQAHKHIRADRISPLDDAFTFGQFSGLFGLVPEGKRCSIKYFCISQPGVVGVGNGYLQDILYRAKIHPRRQVVNISQDEKQGLYGAILGVLKEAVALGGRDTERDLYSQRGRYVRTLHSKVVGQPCQGCGSPIEKAQYLGGAIYFCSACQT